MRYYVVLLDGRTVGGRSILIIQDHQFIWAMCANCPIPDELNTIHWQHGQHACSICGTIYTMRDPGGVARAFDPGKVKTNTQQFTNWLSEYLDIPADQIEVGIK